MSKGTGYTLQNTPTDLADAFVTAMFTQTRAGMRAANAKAAESSEAHAEVVEADRLENRIDTEDFLKFLFRIIRTAEARVCEDPAWLGVVEQARERLGEVTNVAMAYNALNYRQDPMSGASMAECARVLGISVPSASARVSRGLQVMSERVAAAGDTRFAEAARERALVKALHGTGVVVMADFRERRTAARQGRPAAAPVAEAV